MEFDREVFDLMPSGSKTFNLIGLKMPSDKDIFFRAKQKETLDKYQAARRFMYELETDDWDHYFHKLEDENGNIYFQNVLKAQWYEAALLFYNAVVDLSWIACYISAEYFIYVDGKPVEVEGLTPIEEAYNALRKAEGYVQHPGVDGNPFEYLRKMCPQFSDTLDFVIAFWKDFADTPVRWKYNYLKPVSYTHLKARRVALCEPPGLRQEILPQLTHAGRGAAPAGDYSRPQHRPAELGWPHPPNHGGVGGGGHPVPRQRHEPWRHRPQAGGAGGAVPKAAGKGGG